jgi:CheY-like chemotaxis protein
MKRVLVVDDEPTIRDVLTEALREANYHVDTAAHGADALQLMHRHLPDAIVLDLMMPRLDGTAFLELMRLNPRFASVPVLLVTAAYGAAEVATRMGVQAWITKPFELDDVVEAVQNLVGEPLAGEPLVGEPQPLARDGSSRAEKPFAAGA